jgi:hypothetical protein
VLESEDGAYPLMIDFCGRRLSSLVNRLRPLLERHALLGGFDRDAFPWTGADTRS